MFLKHGLKSTFSLFGYLLVLWLAASLYLVADGLQDRIGHADVALVLGNTVNPDGSLSPRLQARLDKTLTLYQAGYFRTIITSGAIGKEGHDEAVVMKIYLQEHGVNASDIWVDSLGRTTLASARNTWALAKQRHFTSVLVISQYFHLPRSRFILQQCQIPLVYSAHADFFEWRDIYSSLREPIAFFSYLVRHYPCGT